MSSVTNHQTKFGGGGGGGGGGGSVAGRGLQELPLYMKPGCALTGFTLNKFETVYFFSVSLKRI